MAEYRLWRSAQLVHSGSIRAEKRLAIIERKFDIVRWLCVLRGGDMPLSVTTGTIRVQAWSQLGGPSCECPEPRAATMGHLRARCEVSQDASLFWYRPAQSPKADERLLTA